MVELYSELGCMMGMIDNFGNKIGKGGFGMMYHGKLQTKQDVAMKFWALRSHSTTTNFQIFERVKSLNAY